MTDQSPGAEQRAERIFAASEKKKTQPPMNRDRETWRDAVVAAIRDFRFKTEPDQTVEGFAVNHYDARDLADAILSLPSVGGGELESGAVCRDVLAYGIHLAADERKPCIPLTCDEADFLADTALALLFPQAALSTPDAGRGSEEDQGRHLAQDGLPPGETRPAALSEPSVQPGEAIKCKLQYGVQMTNARESAKVVYLFAENAAAARDLANKMMPGWSAYSAIAAEPPYVIAPPYPSDLAMAGPGIASFALAAEGSETPPGATPERQRSSGEPPQVPASPRGDSEPSARGEGQ